MAKQLNVSLSVTADTGQAKAQLQQLQQSLQQLTSSSTNLQLGINAADIQKASAAALELSAHLKQATNINTGTLDFAKLNNSLIANKKNLSDYGDALLKLGPQGQQAFQQLTQSIAQSEVPTKRLTSLFGEFGTVLKNTIRWQLSSSAIHSFMGAVSTAYHYAQDLNKSLNNIQIVTGASDAKMAKFAESANKAAKALSTSTTAYTDASLIYYQQGLNDKEVAARTETTIKMANITGQSAQKVSDQMTAIWNNFAKGSTNLEYYADVITALGAATASSSEEISIGLEKFASIADTVGLSYENATAALATITATTRQSADSVGTGLRTLFSRLQSVSLGETLEDGVNLTKYSQALEKVGISVLDTSGELRDMDDILNDLGGKWQDLSKAQQTALAQTVGGVRQYATLIALMDNFDFYKENLQIAQTSEGTVARQAEIYASSWEGASKRVQAATQAIYTDLIDDKAFTNILNSFEKVLTFLDSFIDGIGGLKGLLTGLGTIVTTVFQKQFTQGIYNAGVKLKEFFTPQSAHLAAREKFLSDAAERAINYETSSSYQIKTRQDLFKSQLDNESAFITRSAMMTPFQQDLGRMYLDAQRQARDNYEKAVQATEKASDKRGDAQATLYSNFKVGPDKKAAFHANAAAAINSRTTPLTPEKIAQYQAKGYYQDPKTLQWSYNPRLAQFKQELGRIDTPLQNLDNFNRGLVKGGITADNIGQKIGELFDKSFGTDVAKNPLAKPEIKQRVMDAMSDATGQGLEAQLKAAQTTMKTAVNAQLDEDVAKMAAVHKKDWTEDDIKAYRETRSAELDAKFKEWQAKTQAEQSGKNAKVFINDAQAGKNVAEVFSKMATGAMALTGMSSSLDSMTSSIQGLANGSIDAGQGVTQLVSGLSQFGMMAGMAFKSLGLVGGLIVTVASAVLSIAKQTGLIDKVLNTLSPNRAASQAANQAKEVNDQAQQTAQSTRQEQTTLKDNLNSLDELSAAMKNLTKGTLQYLNTLDQINAILDNQVEKNKWLQDDTTHQYIDVDPVTGARYLTAEGKSRLEQEAENRADSAAKRAAVANLQTKVTETKKAETVQENLSGDNGGLARVNEIGLGNIFIASQFLPTGSFVSPQAAQWGTEQFSKIITDTVTEKWEQADETIIRNISSERAAFEKAFNLIAATNEEKDVNERGVTTHEVTDQEQIATNILVGDYYTLDKNGTVINNRNLPWQITQEQLEQYGDKFGYTENDLGDDNALITKYVSDKVLAELGKTREELTLEDIANLGEKAQDIGSLHGAKLVKVFEEATGEIFTDQSELYMQESIKNQQRSNLLEKQYNDKIAQIKALEKKAENNKDTNMLTLINASDNSLKQISEAINNYDSSKYANDEETAKIAEELYNAQNIQYIALRDSYSSLFKTDEKLGSQLFSHLENSNVTISEAKILKNAITEARSLFDTEDNEDFSKMLAEKLFDKDTFGNDILNKTLLDSLGQIDWSNGLSALADFKKLSNQATQLGLGKLSQDYLDLFDQAKENLGGDKGLLEELFGSTDFQESLESLQKEFKKTGKLSSKDIMDIADSCESLNNYLEYGEQSASALAGAIEVMSLGGISSIDQISPAFLDAMKAAGAFEDQLQSVFKFIDEFSVDRSIQDIADFFSETSDDMFTELGNGNYGGERLYQEAAAVWGEGYATNLRNFFTETQREMLDEDLGPEYLQEKYSEQFDAFDEVMQTVADEGNMRAYWDFLLKGGGDQILGEEFNNEYGYSRLNANDESGRRLKISEALEEIGITNKGDNGDIEVDLRGRTTKDFTQEVADALGISYEEAELRVQEMSGKSSPLAHDLKRNDAVASLSAFGDQYKDHGEITPQGIAKGFKEMSWAEQAAFLKEYGDILTEVDKELKTNFESLNKQREAQEAAVATARAAGEDMSESIGAIVAAHEDLIATTEVNGKTQKDFGKTMANLQATGYTEEEVFAAIKDGTLDLADAVYVAEDAFGNKLPIAIRDANGELKSMEAIMSEAELKIHDSNIAHDAGIYAQEFKKAFSDSDIGPMDVEINVTDNGTVEAVQAKIDTIEGVEAQVSVVDNGMIEDVQGRIDGIEGVEAQVSVVDNGMIEDVQNRINNITGTTVDVAIEGIDNVTSVVDDILARNNGKSVNISLNTTGGTNATGGYVPFGSAANGVNPKSNRKVRPGLSLTGEEGPEIVWNKYEGYSYVVGEKHPEFITLYPGDRVFNAQETKKILSSNALGGKVYESNAAVSAAYTPGVGPKKKPSSSTNTSDTNTSSSDFTPERYHLITRQIIELTRLYDLLSDKKEKAYGTNKLKAIQDEIGATNELIDAQKAYIKEIERYIEEDKQKLSELSINVEFDAFGNIANYDELQNTIGKAAAENKDDETLQDQWDAIEQYEETIDKFHDAQTELQNKIYDLAELQLERITTKLELKIDFDDKELDLIDYQLKKIGDSAYAAATAIAKTAEKLEWTADKVTGAQKNIHELFAEMKDSQGNAVLKEDGTAYTLQEFLGLTPQQREDLDINDDFGKALEDNLETIIETIEDLNDLKTEGIDKFTDAFNELNDGISKMVDNFEHYKNVLSTLKDIVGLQGLKLPSELQNLLQSINQTAFNNIQNSIDAQQRQYEQAKKDYEKLETTAKQYEALYGKADERTIKAWKLAEQQQTNINSLQENLFSSWQEGADFAKTIFDELMDSIVADYEEAISGMYETVDEFQKAWDQQKKNEDFYVQDYEKYYQISKLQRSITKDLDAAQKAGAKQSEGLKRLYADLNEAREAGIILSAYDLDIFEKRYEYEKALADLEDARNAKSIVRLQRDRNGNWGYVYTTNEDDEDLIAKQQAVDDKFYELQRATQERISSLSEDMMSEITGVGQRLQELRASGASQEVIDKYLSQERLYLDNYRKGLTKALADAGMTEEEARIRYGDEGFNILDNFQETLLSAITGGEEGLDTFFARIGRLISTTDLSMAGAVRQYEDNLNQINSWFNENGKGLSQVIGGLIGTIGEDSKTNVEKTQEKINEATDLLKDIYKALEEYNSWWNAQIGALEQYYKDQGFDSVDDFLVQMIKALHALNDDDEKDRQEKAASFDGGGYTGTWGPQGKLAVLHEKENIFNQDDTSNLLVAANILRTIDLQSSILSHGLGEIITPGISQGITTDFEQAVTIHAEFPNAVDHLEIEEAFNNLSNKAIQYANKKNKGIGL